MLLLVARLAQGLAHGLLERGRPAVERAGDEVREDLGVGVGLQGDALGDRGVLLGAVIAVPLVSVVWSVYSELHVRDAPVVGELPTYNAERNA